MTPTTSGPNKQHLVRACSIATSLLVVLLALSMAAPSLVSCEEQLTVESRQEKDNEELADTIKYLEKLEKLDNYWSEVGRPRFGRSDYKQPHRLPLGGSVARPLAPLQNSDNEPQYSSLMELVRARMGPKYN